MTGTAIIPARGGSERVPRKALRLLGGKPLICWTIDQAHRCGLVPLVVTDDDEIEEVAKSRDARVARVPHMHALHGTLGYLTALPVQPPALLLLPTCPLRRDETIRTLLGVGGPAVCVRRSREVFRSRLDDGVFDCKGPRQRTQDLGWYTEAAGAWHLAYDVVGLDVSVWRPKPAHLQLSPSSFAVPVTAIEALDLDTEEDWTIAEALIAAGAV